MRIDPEDLRRHYASLSDDELLALDREELTDTAKKLYDDELAQRDLQPAREDFAEEIAENLADNADSESPPDWADDAACVCAFPASADPYSTEVDQSKAVLRNAGIPCWVTLNRADPSGVGPSRSEYCVMVPSAFNLHATSVLDRDIFNARQEEEWRTHFQALSDDDLQAQKIDVLCAGLMDRVARLRKAYQDEISQRGLNPR